MTSMSLETELAIFGHQIPFISQRHFIQWPQIGEKGEKPADKWDTLVLLFELHGSNTRRKVLRAQRNVHRKDIVRVESFYNRGDHAGDYDYSISDGVVDELLNEGCVEGTPQWGYTDKYELRLTDRGIRALFEHLKTLYPKEEPEEKK